MIETYIIVLIYSNAMMIAEPRNDLLACVAEARGKIGEEWKPLYWDNMNGSNPLPKIAIAFCAQGAAAK